MTTAEPPDPSPEPTPGATRGTTPARHDSSRRAATPDEVRALAHPLRLRIIRETLDAPLTNNEIAERVGRDKATVLHHVRVLVDHGFLDPDPPRRGARGSREIPYRSTGKSWTLSIEPDVGSSAVTGAMLSAFTEEFAVARALAEPDTTRLALRLTAADQSEFAARLEALLEEFRLRSDPEGVPLAFFATLYRRPARS